MSTLRFVHEPAQYQIQVQGRLPDGWHKMFGDLHEQTEGEGTRVITTLTGSLPDQAALNGLLQALHGLGLTLFSVRRIEHVQYPDSNQQESAP
jgi:hypothetical protein